MNLHCRVCGDDDPTQEDLSLCTSCWWRLYRILVKSATSQREAREEIEISYACFVILDDPPPAIAKFIQRVKFHRQRKRVVAPGQGKRGRSG